MELPPPNGRPFRSNLQKLELTGPELLSDSNCMETRNLSWSPQNLHPPPSPAFSCRENTGLAELHRYSSRPAAFSGKDTPSNTSNETNLCCELSSFSMGEVSVREFDTVTWNKSRDCKQMRKLIHSCYIRVTGVTLPDRAQFLSEVERLVASHTLHGSESLCKLLRYLAKQAVEHPGVPVKEYQIATEVFGRQPDFDPQLDSMVRVQAGRLRSKLAEYYSTEGASDRFVVEVPKGSYTVAFHERAGATHGNGSAAGTWATNPVESAASATTRRYLVRGLSFALAAALAMVGWLLWTRRDSGISSASAAADTSAPAPIRIFWRGFVRGTEAPWVIFSNAAF